MKAEVDNLRPYPFTFRVTTGLTVWAQVRERDLAEAIAPAVDQYLEQRRVEGSTPSYE